jgi:uncharacterized protein YbjQ (UPF0145 family)
MKKIIVLLVLSVSITAQAKESQWLGIYTTDQVLGSCTISSHLPFNIKTGVDVRTKKLSDWLDEKQNTLVNQAKSKGFNAIVGFQENFISSGQSSFVSYWGVAVKAVCK